MLRYLPRWRHVIESLAHTQLDIPEDKFDTPVQWHVYFCLSSINPLLYNRDRRYLLYVATYRQFWQPHTQNRSVQPTMLHVLTSSLVIRDCGFGTEFWIVINDLPKCYDHLCTDITVPPSYSFIRFLKVARKANTNTENSAVNKRATRTLTGAAMLLLLRRTLSNAFQKFQERTIVEKRRWTQWSFGHNINKNCS